MTKNIFDTAITAEVVQRINNLTPETPQLWGKMDVAQMLAHCNVTYEYIYEDIHGKPSGFKKFILKLIVKPLVVGEKAYKKNNPTAPAFIIKSEKDFEAEKKRLIDFVVKSQELGANHFDGLESVSFGKLNQQEWNNMFYKHLDHHLSQFGV